MKTGEFGNEVNRTMPGILPIMPDRTASITRKTGETDITLSLNLDGTGVASIKTGVGFFDHMLDLFARHGLFDLTVAAAGDLHVDSHHTVEDVGIVLGQAIDRAVGDKRGIARYGWAVVPMDESLAQVAIDLSGRPVYVSRVTYTSELIGTFSTELFDEFWKSVSTHARMNLHITVPYGSNSHHIAEAIFKATARALRMAVAMDPRQTGVPSTKGSL
jgi:imidazoleglycerol-phosphate dehydratase